MSHSDIWPFSLEHLTEDVAAFLRWFRDGTRLQPIEPDDIHKRYIDIDCPPEVALFIEAAIGADHSRTDFRGRYYPLEKLEELFNTTFAAAREISSKRWRQEAQSAFAVKEALRTKSKRRRGPRIAPYTVRWKLCDQKVAEDLLNAAERSSDARSDCLMACRDAATRLLPVPREQHIASLDLLAKQFPNFKSVVDIYLPEIRLQSKLREPMRLPTILMQGSPGVGKTAFALALAESMQFSMQIRSFAELSAGFLLSGSSETWQGGRPGLIAEHCARAPDKTAPLIVIDEIDKSGPGSYSPDRSLLSVLEQNTAKRFRDENLGLELDVRPLSWIFTSNRLDGIRPELKSRMTIVEVEAPTRSQMPDIVRSVDRAVRRERPRLCEFFLPLDDRVIDALAAQSPRQLRRVLMLAYAEAATAHKGDEPISLEPDVLRKFTAPTQQPAPIEDKARPEPIYLAPGSWVRVH